MGFSFANIKLIVPPVTDVATNEISIISGIASIW